MFSVSSKTSSKATWLLDSGASSHMTHAKEDFETFKPIGGRLDVCVANGAHLEVRGVGEVRFGVGGRKTVVVTNVLFVPELDRKLLSMRALSVMGACEDADRGGG